MLHEEQHRQHRVSWLRASVLGANDGIISTSSLIIGVIAANLAYESILVTALAALVAGAISMAAGEYVSVCAQSDTEKSDLLIEANALKDNYEEEVIELAEIYQKRGLAYELSLQVARQLMAKDALGAHARDEIGIVDNSKAQPVLAAVSSAISFTVGALLPLSIVLFASYENIAAMVVLVTLIALGALGAISSFLGGAKLHKGILRVTFWGAIAMIATFLLGSGFKA